MRGRREEPDTSEMSLDEIKRRAQAAGVTIREDRWEMVRKLLADALRPIRALDSRTAQALEPAVTFDAAGGAGDERRR